MKSLGNVGQSLWTTTISTFTILAILACLASIFLRLPIVVVGYQEERIGEIRISEGLIANKSQFPYFAYLFSQTSENSSYKFICGASILDERYILTAASCVIGRRKESDLEILVGSIDGYSGIRYKVKRVCTSGYFNVVNQSFNDNFALLLISKGIKFNERIKPIKATPEKDGEKFVDLYHEPEKYWFSSADCYAVGAGLRNEDETIVGDLYYAKVKLRNCYADRIGVASNTCYRHLGSISGVSCLYDQGGPIVCKKDGVDQIVGIMSSTVEPCSSYGAVIGLNELARYQRFLATSLPDCVNWFQSVLQVESDKL